MTQDPRVQRPAVNPEVLSSGREVGEGEEFNELLRGMLDLTSAEGNVTAVDFIERMLAEMEKMGVEATDYRINLILLYGVGSREKVLDRVADMTTEDFDRTYPGIVGELVEWYLEPLLAR